jgi:hypothetical protein
MASVLASSAVVLGSNPDVGYQKLGPGYSVINPENVNQSNENLQLFKDLAENIEQTMNEEIAEIDREV